MNKFNIIDVTDAFDPLLDKVKGLYMVSFPEEERRPWENIVDMIESSSPFFRLRVIVGEESKFLGFITQWSLPATKYIEHFAIEPAQRSHGVGSEVISRIVAEAGDEPVVLEVELPESNPDAVKRIEFYSRNGFMAMEDFPYFQPPYRPDLEMVPLMLMTSRKLEDPERFVIMLHTLVYNQ